MGDVEYGDPHEELNRLGAHIESATELGALRPVYYRLEELIQAFPGDADVQAAGTRLKQRLIARGTVLKQQIMPSPEVLPPTPSGMPMTQSTPPASSPNTLPPPAVQGFPSPGAAVGQLRPKRKLAVVIIGAVIVAIGGLLALRLIYALVDQAHPGILLPT